jgi:hypothetical protein
MNTPKKKKKEEAIKFIETTGERKTLNRCREIEHDYQGLANSLISIVWTGNKNN